MPFYVIGAKFAPSEVPGMDGPFATLPLATTAANVWATSGGAGVVVFYNPALLPAFPWTLISQNTNVLYVLMDTFCVADTILPSTGVGVYIKGGAYVDAYQNAWRSLVPCAIQWDSGSRIWTLVPWVVPLPGGGFGGVLRALATGAR